MHVGVGGHGGAHVDADGGGVNQLYLGNPVRIDFFNVGGQFFFFYGGIERRDQAFQHQSGFAGAGYAGDHGEPPFGNGYVQGMHGVDGPGFQIDGAVFKKSAFFCEGPYLAVVIIS